MGAISKVLRARDRALDELEELLSPLWGSLADELGFRGRGTAVPHAKEIALLGDVVKLTYVINTPKTGNKKGSKRKVMLTIPCEVLDGGLAKIQKFLRYAFPIRCAVCGSSLPIGTQPWDSTYCWHMPYWRPEAPKPQFYIGQEKFGYAIPSRGRRYVVDVESSRLVALQIQNRTTNAWYTPPADIMNNHIGWFAAGILPAIPSALGGKLVPLVNVRNFAFELPEWCVGSVWL